MLGAYVGILFILMKVVFCSGFLQSRLQNAPQRTLLNSAIVSSVEKHLPDPFWKEGLKFGCTGCGRCCQNEGDVWLDSEEFAALVRSLHLPAKTVLSTYVEDVMSGWVKLKDKKMASSSHVDTRDQCVFLSEDGSSCTIYESRPVQCRTYPYWPRLMSSKEEWDKERVVPDDQVGKHWSATTGRFRSTIPLNAPI